MKKKKRSPRAEEFLPLDYFITRLPHQFTELYCGNFGLSELHPTFAEFCNVQSLWIQENHLESLEGIVTHPPSDPKERATYHRKGMYGLKELYCHENKIESIPPFIRSFRYLEVLVMNDNLLQNLTRVLEDIRHCVFIEHIDFFNNPIEKEPRYRERIICTFKKLKVLDRITLTENDRIEAHYNLLGKKKEESTGRKIIFGKIFNPDKDKRLTQSLSPKSLKKALKNGKKKKPVTVHHINIAKDKPWKKYEWENEADLDDVLGKIEEYKSACRENNLFPYEFNTIGILSSRKKKKKKRKKKIVSDTTTEQENFDRFKCPEMIHTLNFRGILDERKLKFLKNYGRHNGISELHFHFPFLSNTVFKDDEISKPNTPQTPEKKKLSARKSKILSSFESDRVPPFRPLFVKIIEHYLSVSDIRNDELIDEKRGVNGRLKHLCVLRKQQDIETPKKSKKKKKSPKKSSKNTKRRKSVAQEEEEELKKELKELEELDEMMCDEKDEEDDEKEKERYGEEIDGEFVELEYGDIIVNGKVRRKKRLEHLVAVRDEYLEDLERWRENRKKRKEEQQRLLELEREGELDESPKKKRKKSKKKEESATSSNKSKRSGRGGKGKKKKKLSKEEEQLEIQIQQMKQQLHKIDTLELNNIITYSKWEIIKSEFCRWCDEWDKKYGKRLKKKKKSFRGDFLYDGNTYFYL